MVHEDDELLLGRMSDLEADVVAPKDKFLLVLVTCIALGISVLFPWNTLITASSFWSFVFGDEAGTFIFWLSAAFNWPQVPVLLIVTKWGPLFSFTSRICAGLGLFIITLLAIPLFCSIGISLTLKWIVTLTLAFVAGSAQGVLFGTMMGFAAIFPGKYTTAMMSGQGIGGVIVGLMAALFQLLIPDDATTQAWLYFGSASLIIFCTLVFYLLAVRMPYAKYNVSKYYAAVKVQEPTNATDDLKKEETHNAAWYLTVMKKIWVDAFTVFFVFFVTLCLFPGLMLATPLENDDYSAWFAILVPLLFNIFDTTGRTLPYIAMVRFPPKFLWIISVLRVIFFPLFIFCVNPVLFPAPALWVFGFLIIFGLSNGYTGTLAMMYAPAKVDPDEQQVSGIMMSFFLNLGIFLATNFAILLNYLIVPASS